MSEIKEVRRFCTLLPEGDDAVWAVEASDYDQLKESNAQLKAVNAKYEAALREIRDSTLDRRRSAQALRNIAHEALIFDAELAALGPSCVCWNKPCTCQGEK